MEANYFRIKDLKGYIIKNNMVKPLHNFLLNHQVGLLFNQNILILPKMMVGLVGKAATFRRFHSTYYGAAVKYYYYLLANIK